MTPLFCRFYPNWVNYNTTPVALLGETQVVTLGETPRPQRGSSVALLGVSPRPLRVRPSGTLRPLGRPQDPYEFATCSTWGDPKTAPGYRTDSPLALLGEAPRPHPDTAPGYAHSPRPHWLLYPIAKGIWECFSHNVQRAVDVLLG